MATTNSFADLMLDWQKLLAACADNASSLTAAEPQRLVVEKMLKDAQDLKAQQDSHTAAKQAIVQQLGDMLHAGREAARCLRGAVKANMGTKNERLVQFGVAPIRPRPKKAKQVPPPEPQPAPGPTPAPTPAPSSSPAAHGTALNDPGGGGEKGAPRNPTAP